MVAGGAKAALECYNLSLGLPTVFTGRSRTISFPSSVRPLCIHFHTPWGPMAVEVGLDLQDEPSIDFAASAAAGSMQE
jgi:chemotaxis protein CheX